MATHHDPNGTQHTGPKHAANNQYRTLRKQAQQRRYFAIQLAWQAPAQQAR